MSKRKQNENVNSVECDADQTTENQNGKGSTFVVTVVNDSIQGMHEWTEEETNLVKEAVDADGGQYNWDVIASAVPSKDVNQVKAYVMGMQQQDNSANQSANIIKAPIEIWTDLAQKLTSEDDKSASVCLPQEEIYAVQAEIREMIADQQNKLNKLFSSLRGIKRTVKKAKRLNRRKLAEQNAKIDTLISLLATNTLPNPATLSPTVGSSEKDKSKKKIILSTTRSNAAGKDALACSTAEHKQILPLITVSGPTDMELSPYSLVPIGQNTNIMLTRQQYNDAYYRGKNIRRFAVRLAEKIFGLDVLAQSTVSGQQTGLEKLDVDKLSAIRVEVMSRFMQTSTLDEREAKWKECLLSIGKRCQVLRSGRALKQELLNPSSSCDDVESLALVPISNASEENTAAQSISTPANVTLEVDKSLGVSQKPTPQINLVPLGGSPNVLIQKEDLSEAVKRGKKATFLALRLAEKVFGYDVMLGSTITGREGTEKLDNDKLMAIREEIVNRFAREQPIELQEAIWKKCLYSISTKCKVLRAQKQLNLGGIIYDDEYNEMKECGDLDLLANVTCPENQREIHKALLEQAGHIVTSEDNVAQESDVVQQEGEIAGQGGDIVEQEGGMITQDGNVVQREDDITSEGNIVTAEDGVVAGTNHITEDEVAIEHEQEVTATIQIDQSNGLCEQPMQVGELVEQEGAYV
ncbi:uncharacterized protein LOC114524772 [Dendronephthya gigantea]|uniref:uncharacterized protein LOC114524772 n=1 Tax=Dendronephthya gigantea TaxID=151771 RepID=UPI00106B721D|nr:uncharacterized protein LOC114524772 [Dendronephthya gigantea]